MAIRMLSDMDKLERKTILAALAFWRGNLNTLVRDGDPIVMYASENGHWLDEDQIAALIDKLEAQNG